ncbi:unnamed protein product [Closterium sp. NIES-54]
MSLSFTLDSGASLCFFRDHTTFTPLPAPVPDALANPTLGAHFACNSTTLPCPAASSDVLTGLHIPSFSMNLVGVVPLQDLGFGTWFSSHKRVDMLGRCHLGTSGHVSPSSALVQSLPRPLAPSCAPCVEGRLHTTPHSSLRPTNGPFQTLHLEVWGPDPRPRPGGESFFLVVVDDFSCYTTLFPLRKKSDQVAVDSKGVGAGGTVAGGASSEGAGVEGIGAGGARSGGAGAGGAGDGGASSGGAGARGAGTRIASYGGAGAVGART